MATLEFIEPEWDAPAGVRAIVTTRGGGVSAAPYASLNLAMHVGDDPARVTANRRGVYEALDLPAEPAWLEQVHGTDVVSLPCADSPTGDAAVASAPGLVCAVLVADCLPIFLATRAGDRVAIAHAGWRGLAAGVVESAIAGMGSDPGNLVAWLGPSIGPAAFEVGPEVRTNFVSRDAGAARDFRPGRDGRYFADLPSLARRRLAGAGVRSIQASGLCTHADAARFYSYRRDGVTGRMAALCWIAG